MTILYLKDMKNKNIIVNKMEQLKINNKELGFLIKEDLKDIKKWQEDSKKIPKNVIKKIESLPKESPYKFKGNKNFTFIDLFAGIGGIRLGFQKEKGICLFSAEWNQKSAATYRVNYGETPHGDITKISSKEIPDFDILLGGFPCQSFSQAGLKKGFEDTRGTLFFDVARILAEKKPSAFLLENVKGLVGHDKGNTFLVIKKSLEDLEYKVFHKVLISRDFGVPQNRQRIIIVGFLKSKFPKGFDFDKEFSYPQPLEKKVKVGDILEDSKKIDDKYTISNALWLGHQTRKAKHKSNRNGFGYQMFNENSPYTSTISARYYKDGAEALIDQSKLGKNPRKLTPRECARLQGFPEDFLLPVSDNEAYKQFGNSVTVPLVNAVAKQIIKVLNKRKKD